MLKITKVKRNSVAKALGLEKGDKIIAFDGLPCEDELDIVYFTEQESFSMTVQNKRTGEEHTLQVEKQAGESLGIGFAKDEKIKTCHNRCVFCFVDQMPKGMRESLYVKDDDYAMSFACGNFVTLTNVSDEALARIVRLQLSPLYVSVHTINPDLRVKLLRNRHAGKIAQQIDTLVKGGIKLHCQAVIVPNENDGEELAKTARALFQYYPMVQDIACVPTGLTKYRAGLYQIDDVDKAYSEKLLDLVDGLNKEFGVNFLLPADEYFVKAERQMKPVGFYGDFSQIENGIGLTAKFLAEANAALAEIVAKNQAPSLQKQKHSVIICGTSAAQTLKELVEKCNRTIENLCVTLLPVENDFFGRTVTCTGLLTGKDTVKALQTYFAEGGKADEIILSSQMLKEFEDVFLCGMTLKQMKKILRFKNVKVNRTGGVGLIALLAEEAGR